jgi:hypothetical protein
MKPQYVDLLRDVLDHQLVDAEGMPCGQVDDLVIEGSPGSKLLVTALLVGPGAWMNRLPRRVRLLLGRVVGKRCTRVPWSEVAVITQNIKLRSSASALGLGAADRKLGRWIARLPGS